MDRSYAIATKPNQSKEALETAFTELNSSDHEYAEFLAEQLTTAGQMFGKVESSPQQGTRRASWLRTVPHAAKSSNDPSAPRPPIGLKPD